MTITIFSYCVLIMDEEQMIKKKAEVFITVDNFVAVSFLMAVLVRKQN